MSLRPVSRFPAVLLALLPLALGSPVPGLAAPPGGAQRTETAVTGSSPITSVAESAVRVKVPLPASVGAHPEACDWLSYLRFRSVSGPADPAAADRILVAQPGVLEGAGAFDSVARNTVDLAARQGRHIEFWALDRRSNCLEDHTGVEAGLAAGDVHVAVDYYYRGRIAGGRKFAGYPTNDQVKWLQNIGLEQTVRDQYDLLGAELPGVAREKVLCGGHSLGGILTAFFAQWDFDGNPATTADAGYMRCGGYFALDTRIQRTLPGTDPGSQVPGVDLGPAFVRNALDWGLIPRTLSAPAVINSETMNLLAVAGLAARLDPAGESDLATSIPPGFNQDSTYRVLFSKDLATFAAGTPTVKDFRFTNAAALGGLLDDNSEPLAFLQASVGFFTGGRIADKSFPLPNDLVRTPGLEGLARLAGTERKAIPDEPRGPLYGWQDYDALKDVPKSADGTPFTTPAKEVTSIGELARSLSEHPLDFTEHFFPTKIVTDIALGSSPEITRDAVHLGGTTANPTITLLAGDGILAGDDTGTIFGQVVVAPGYQHLDVLTAAAVQNGGGPDPVSANLVEFAAR
ncbi:hypothetical protein [Actinocorallia longicatena]|uniref:Lipase (Class 3) n=1 Tax=Actinocorallia longicatena TaxID=111803 RepID=A0ABP6QIW9_9ACTN